ncbi:RagB/SusD family nutrient uptake outer membrane protein [Paraflavitalea sp. CAU 1676]|uniref:RagB/SusD family nutrient uptake outer membrane protein n=1 Tax=Paraflavitalea sp. CAU 1676 TaxID=3032598 RepID=UPI0023DBF1AF|nr:RagB/SusD family nutrient uptake outer membrane protein [Paraflavitalea sp. CAU 1676]MDF2189796.1 RagB/SusD family nutrient uptake outer membrane protein [Paraflavitalea sp. CAU 1676]
MKYLLKKYSVIVFYSFILLGSQGCNKFLDEGNDPSNLSPDIYYTLPEHADAAIAAAYARTRFIGEGAGIFVQNFSMLEAVTGTARTETAQNSDLNNLFGLVHNGDNLLVNNWWNGLYNVIAQTNLVMDKVPGIDMEEARKNKVLGEAKFLRAWAYFYLVRLWGDVPLLTKPIYSSGDSSFTPKRTGSQAVYDKIVADLTEAEASGIPWTDASGRATLGATKALLAEVYLTMAGQPLNKGAAYYTLAANKAKEVISNGSFSLFTTYNDLHSLAQENKGEHMFEIQYLASVAGNPIQPILLPNFKGVSKYGTEVGSTVPTPAFFASYEAGDARTVDRQGFFYTSYYNEGFGPLKNLGAPYIFKHFDVVAHGTFNVEGTAQSDLNWPQIRYAQVLLTYAEAQNESGAAPNTDAWNALKAIRDRAKLATPALGTFNTASFRQAVWRERWHELCYEGITWMDMVRTRKAYKESNNTFEDFVGHVFADNGAKLEQKHLLFPLPTTEIRNNPNLRPQNPGYPE